MTINSWEHSDWHFKQFHFYEYTPYQGAAQEGRRGGAGFETKFEDAQADLRVARTRSDLKDEKDMNSRGKKDIKRLEENIKGHKQTIERLPI